MQFPSWHRAADHLGSGSVWEMGTPRCPKGHYKMRPASAYQDGMAAGRKRIFLPGSGADSSIVTRKKIGPLRRIESGPTCLVIQTAADSSTRDKGDRAGNKSG